MLFRSLGAFGVRIPVVYLVSRLEDPSLFQIGLATPASSAVQIALCVGMFAVLQRASSPRTGV